MPVQQSEFIRKYVTAIREGHAAVFAGAGLSRSSGFVDWKNLLKPLAEDIGLDINRESDLLNVAQYYKNSRGRNEIDRAIQEEFAKGASPNENADILTRLPISTYWTTNYDCILEDSLKKANRNADIKYGRDQISIIKPDRDCILYKMHGDVNHPTDAVITRQDYEFYDYKYPLFKTALKSDLLSKVFLFVGFSFEDPNLGYILSQIHALLGPDYFHNHYCFFKRVCESDYKDLADYNYAKGKQDMQVANLAEYCIQVVYVDDYPEITDILKQVEQTSKLRNVFISGSSTPDGWVGSTWTQEKAEELAGKISASLVHGNCRITTGFGLGIGSAVISGALRIIYSEKYRHVDEHLCMRPFPQNIKDKDEREKTWKQYREEMLGETGISIFMFGNKKDTASGKVIAASGCKQEYEIAKKEGNLIIPIGSTGFAAKEIYDDVKANIADYPYLKNYIDDLGSVMDVNKLVNIVTEIVKEKTDL